MNITFHKGCCFRIQTSGTNLTIQLPDGNISRIKSDILIRTNLKSTDGNAEHIIKGPGEYEIQGIRIRGFHPSTYLVKSEDLKLVYLTTDVSNERLGDPDILILNSSDKAAEIIRQLHPKIVIVSDKEKELEKELGMETEASTKLSIKKKDLLGDKEAKPRLILLKS